MFFIVSDYMSDAVKYCLALLVAILVGCYPVGSKGGRDNSIWLSVPEERKSDSVFMEELYRIIVSYPDSITALLPNGSLDTFRLDGGYRVLYSYGQSGENCLVTAILIFNDETLMGYNLSIDADRYDAASNGCLSRVSSDLAEKFQMLVGSMPIYFDTKDLIDSSCDRRLFPIMNPMYGFFLSSVYQSGFPDKDSLTEKDYMCLLASKNSLAKAVGAREYLSQAEFFRSHAIDSLIDSMLYNWDLRYLLVKNSRFADQHLRASLDSIDLEAFIKGRTKFTPRIVDDGYFSIDRPDN